MLINETIAQPLVHTRVSNKPNKLRHQLREHFPRAEVTEDEYDRNARTKFSRHWLDIFDLNAIPVIKRYHFCYTRGLSLDLLEWFFENYSFSSVELEEEDIDAFGNIFVPFMVHIGRQIAKYKHSAEENGRTAPSTYAQVNFQIQSALFSLESARDVWLEEKAAEEENDHNQVNEESGEANAWDLEWNLSDYMVTRRDIPAERKSSENFLENGKSSADRHFFRGLAFQFKLDDSGKKILSKRLCIARVCDLAILFF